MKKQLRELTDNEVNSGRNYAKEILKNIGSKVATIVGAGAALYGAKAILTKDFGATVFNGGAKKK